MEPSGSSILAVLTPTVWLAIGAGVASIAILLVWGRAGGYFVHYPVVVGGPCYSMTRGSVVARGAAKGTLVAVVPTAVLLHSFGPLPAAFSLLLGFFIGTVVYSHWLMRLWSSLDQCPSCTYVTRQLRSLHVASIVLGALSVAVALDLCALSSPATAAATTDGGFE